MHKHITKEEDKKVRMASTNTNFPSPLVPHITSPLFFSPTSTNYETWKDQMTEMIRSKNLLEFIDGRFLPPKPTCDPVIGSDHDHMIMSVNREYMRWKKIDDSLKEMILNSVDKTMISSQTLSSYSARGVWEVLESFYDNFLHDQPSQECIPPQPAQGTDQGVDLAKYIERISGDEGLYKDYLKICIAAKYGDWKTAKVVLENHRGSDSLDFLRIKALLIAIGTGAPAIQFVEQLVPAIGPEFLRAHTPTSGRRTALTIAATVNNKTAAAILVDKLPDLLYIPNGYGEFPVQVAALYSHRETLEFLLSVTEPDVAGPFRASNGLDLLLAVIDSEFYDIALKLVGKYPSLATDVNNEGTSALKLLALKNYSFTNSLGFKFLEHFIFLVPEKMKTRHKMKQAALILVELLCEKIVGLGYEKSKCVWRDALFSATVGGNHLVVKKILDRFPEAASTLTPDTRQNMFHMAVMNRSTEIFDLIHDTGEAMYKATHTPDIRGNNLLHFAAMLAPPNKLEQITGAALQMQYEMQWYKAVEEFVPSYCKNRANSEGYTPYQLFEKNHKNLKEQGEKWMRDTAQSCSIASALISTVMFAAAISVPGGTNNSSGFPIFSKDPAFVVFAVSDAISLFSSTTSVLTFLSILTSRYKENDFWHALPRRLITALLTLFLSIAFLMVAFGATIFIVLGQKKGWVLIPIIALACIPITSFVVLHFRVLLDWISSTWSRKIIVTKPSKNYYSWCV